MKIKLSHIIMLVLSIAIIFVAFYFQQNLSHFKAWGIFGIFMINFIGSATLFLPAPAIATVVAGGALYPIFWVAFFSALGAAGGDMIGYLLGKSSTSVLIDAQKQAWYPKLHALFSKYGGIVILVFAFIPNPLFDVIGIIAGVSSYSPWRFFILLFAGRFFRDIILAAIGSKIF